MQRRGRKARKQVMAKTPDKRKLRRSRKKARKKLPWWW
jgi:hypothetical protein